MQDFEGSLTSLVSQSLQALKEKNTLMIVARMPQVLRPMLELKQKFPDSQDAYYAYAFATKAIMQAYQGEFQKSEQSLLRAVDYFLVIGAPDTVVQEKSDAASWLACSPRYSERTVKTLQKELSGKDMIFIPLANGGIRSGIDVFLRYNSISKNKKSVLLPLRFSRHKMKDTAPQITDLDMRFIKKKVHEGLPIVIFEEDSDTGITRNMAVHFFQEKFPSTHIYAVTNYDSLTDW